MQMRLYICAVDQMYSEHGTEYLDYICHQANVNEIHFFIQCRAKTYHSSNSKIVNKDCKIWYTILAKYKPCTGLEC